MFKSVEFLGFDGQPGLRANAEQFTPVLAGEVRRWREDVSVTWRPDPLDPPDGLNLSLELTLPGGVSGFATGTLTRADRSEPWRVRSQCRQVWADLLGDLLQKQDARVRESLLDLAEV